HAGFADDDFPMIIFVDSDHFDRTIRSYIKLSLELPETQSIRTLQSIWTKRSCSDDGDPTIWKRPLRIGLVYPVTDRGQRISGGRVEVAVKGFQCPNGKVQCRWRGLLPRIVSGRRIVRYDNEADTAEVASCGEQFAIQSLQ